MTAWRRVLLLGVGSPGAGAFLPPTACVGVLARDVGVLERAVGVVVLELRPFATCRFAPVEGESLVDSGLMTSLAVLRCRIDKGSFEAEVWVVVDEVGSRVAPFRVMGCGSF
jgi:hypothetical protein